MLGALTTGPGAGLPVDVAAVELINVLRPTVAVAWLGAFAAVELVRTPELGAVLGRREERAARWRFADEVRRTASFVPALAGRVRGDVDWQGHHLAVGDLLVLDVPGTNDWSWEDPERFRPDRFAERTPNAFQHVPQGGGDPRSGHRCPGEQVAITLLDRTLERLASAQFTVSTAEPDLRRIPTLPGGGVTIEEFEPPVYAAIRA